MQDFEKLGAFTLEPVSVSPRKGDITVEKLVLLWTPWVIGGDGIATPGFRLPRPA